MKITKSQLRKIILKETRKYLSFPSPGSPSQDSLDRLSKAESRGTDIDMIPYPKDIDHGIAFHDPQSDEVLEFDDLYGEGGGFDQTHPRKMPDMYYVYLGLKNLGYQSVDGEPIDHLLFYVGRQ